MATHLDTILAESLRTRADRDVDTALLVRAAVAKGTRIRRRRRTAAGAALVAALGAAAVALPRDPAPAPTDHRIMPAPPALRLPVADGAVGAAQRPDLVGTDPRVLHFSLDNLTGGARRVTWSVSQGSESAEIDAENREVAIQLSHAPTEPPLAFGGGGGRRGPRISVDVGGRDGSVSWRIALGVRGEKLWSVEWQPADGLWANVTARTASHDEAVAVAEAVRFDEARRCALPFRLTSTRVGDTVTRCSVTLSAEAENAFYQGELEVGDGTRILRIRANASFVSELPAKDTIAAGPYRVRRDGHDWQLLVGPYFVDATTLTPRHRYPEPDVLADLGGLRTRGTPDDPATW